MAYIGHVYRVLFGYLILTFLVVVDNLSCVGWINRAVTGRHWRIQTCVLGGGPTHAGAKPRVPPNPVFSSDLGHLFFATALTR